MTQSQDHNTAEEAPWYQVNEIFDAPQGEGGFVGTMCTFIRLQGCTVGCEFCDTKYTWGKGGERMLVEDIVAQIHYPNVIITGGEPLQWDLDNLLKGIREAPGHPVFRIMLETSGAFDFKGHEVPDWITLSPKHMKDYQSSLGSGINVDELKFVVDMAFLEAYSKGIIKDVVATVQPNHGVYLMPEGNPPTEKHIALALEILAKNPYWKFGCRLHTWIGTR